MPHDYGPMQARWYRERNAARFVPGLTRVWVLPIPDGTYLALLPRDLDRDTCERHFAELVMQHWCARYGLPEARSRLLAYLRGEGDSVT